MAVRYSWEKIKNDTKLLSQKIDREDVHALVAVTRGGLFIAGLLSYLLGQRFVYTYGIKTYEGQQAMRAQTLFEPPVEDSRHLLIVDDLVDQGLTMRHIRQCYPGAQKVALYASEECTDLLDEFVEIKPRSWITFPWDFG